MVLPEYYLKYEKLLSRLKMESQWIDAEKRIAKLRFKGQKRKKNGQCDFDDSGKKHKKTQTH